jgi:hypothetical protein
VSWGRSRWSDQPEFVVVTHWDSVAALEAFAGPRWREAVIEPVVWSPPGSRLEPAGSGVDAGSIARLLFLFAPSQQQPTREEEYLPGSSEDEGE